MKAALRNYNLFTSLHLEQPYSPKNLESIMDKSSSRDRKSSHKRYDKFAEIKEYRKAQDVDTFRQVHTENNKQQKLKNKLQKRCRKDESNEEDGENDESAKYSKSSSESDDGRAVPSTIKRVKRIKNSASEREIHKEVDCDETSDQDVCNDNKQVEDNKSNDVYDSDEPLSKRFAKPDEKEQQGMDTKEDKKNNILKVQTLCGELIKSNAITDHTDSKNMKLTLSKFVNHFIRELIYAYHHKWNISLKVFEPLIMDNNDNSNDPKTNFSTLGSTKILRSVQIYEKGLKNFVEESQEVQQKWIRDVLDTLIVKVENEDVNTSNFSFNHLKYFMAMFARRFDQTTLKSITDDNFICNLKIEAKHRKPKKRGRSTTNKITSTSFTPPNAEPTSGSLPRSNNYNILNEFVKNAHNFKTNLSKYIDEVEAIQIIIKYNLAYDKTIYQALQGRVDSYIKVKTIETEVIDEKYFNQVVPSNAKYYVLCIYGNSYLQADFDNNTFVFPTPQLEKDLPQSWLYKFQKKLKPYNVADCFLYVDILIHEKNVLFLDFVKLPESMCSIKDLRTTYSKRNSWYRDNLFLSDSQPFSTIKLQEGSAKKRDSYISFTNELAAINGRTTRLNYSWPGLIALVVGCSTNELLLTGRDNNDNDSKRPRQDKVLLKSSKYVYCTKVQNIGPMANIFLGCERYNLRDFIKISGNCVQNENNGYSLTFKDPRNKNNILSISGIDCTYKNDNQTNDVDYFIFKYPEFVEVRDHRIVRRSSLDVSKVSEFEEFNKIQDNSKTLNVKNKPTVSKVMNIVEKMSKMDQELLLQYMMENKKL